MKPRYSRIEYSFGRSTLDLEFYIANTISPLVMDCNWSVKLYPKDARTLSAAQYVKEGNPATQLLYYFDLLGARQFRPGGSAVEWYQHLNSLNDESIWLHFASPPTPANRLINTVFSITCFNVASPLLLQEWRSQALSLVNTGRELYSACPNDQFDPDFGIALDGVFVDGGSVALRDLYGQTGGLQSVEYGLDQTRWRNDHIAFLNSVKNSFPSGKVLVPNILINYQMSPPEMSQAAHGAVDELIPGISPQYDAGIFFSSRLDAASLGDSAAPQLSPGFLWMPMGIRESLAPGPQTIRDIRTAATMVYMLLDSPVDVRPVLITAGFGTKPITDNMYWQPWMTADLGNPVSKPVKAVNPEGIIWTREFTGGYVALSLRTGGKSFDTPHIVQLPVGETFRDIVTGLAGISGSVTLLNSDGILLQNEAVAPPPSPPLSVTATLVMKTYLTIELAASGSGGTTPYTFVWNFGDGTTIDVQNPTHTYLNPGAYTATVTVTDLAGMQALALLSVTVFPPPPPPPPKPCLIAALASGMGLIHYLPGLRVFRDRRVPEKLIVAYYDLCVSIAKA